MKIKHAFITFAFALVAGLGVVGSLKMNTSLQKAKADGETISSSTEAYLEGQLNNVDCWNTSDTARKFKAGNGEAYLYWTFKAGDIFKVYNVTNNKWAGYHSNIAGDFSGSTSGNITVVTAGTYRITLNNNHASYGDISYAWTASSFKKVSTIPNQNMYRFTVSNSFSSLYLHLWGGASGNTTWGSFKELTEFYYNESSQKVFLFSTNVSYTGMIMISDKNNADNTKSADITVGSNTAWYWNGAKLSNPSPWTPTNRTLYFYDYNNAYSGLKAFGYGSSHEYISGDLAGEAMTAVTNMSGQLYQVSIDPMFEKVSFSSTTGGFVSPLDKEWVNQKACLAVWASDNIELKASGAELNDVFANDWVFQSMHFRDILTSDNSNGSACKGDSGYLSKAVSSYNALSPDVKTKIEDYENWNNGDVEARLNAWASANGKTVTISGGTITLNANKGLMPAVSNDNTVSTVIIVVSVLSITSLGLFLFLKKRKESK